MARSLFRVYLYLVSSLLILFAAIGFAIALSTLLDETSLNPGASSPAYSSITGEQLSTGPNVQYLSLGVIILIIAGGLLGLHYWLIRRDLTGDAGAGAGPVRALFLNLDQLVTALTALIAGDFVLSAFGDPSRGDQAPTTSIATTSILVFVLIELERRRTQAGAGPALIFQRVQQYGMQLVILFFFAPSNVLRALTDSSGALFGTGQTPCQSGYSPYYPCFQPITSKLLVGDWLTVAYVIFAWLVYAFIARGDSRSALRQTARLLGLAFGTGYALSGLYTLFDHLLVTATGGTPPGAPYENTFDPSYSFVAPLVFGVVVVAFHVLLLRADAPGSPLGIPASISAMLAVTALVAAAPFWVGVGGVLHSLVEQLAAAPDRPDANTWSQALALAIAGLPYVPLALALARHAHLTGIPGPRRGFALGLLAAGIITGASGAAAAIYAVVTNLLGVPLADWPEVARGGAVVLIVGAVLTGIYGTISVRDHYLKAPPSTPPSEPVPVPVPPAAEQQTLESILDALVEHRLTRDEAAARIRALTGHIE
jgi:hypothetical protein